MLDGRTKCSDISLRREISRIDEGRRLRIGRCDFDTSTAPRTETDREGVIGFDPTDPQGRGCEHGLNIRTINSRRASEEKVAPCARRRNGQLGFANETYNEAMILKVLTNTSQVAHDCDATTAKILCPSDSGQHEEARRLDHSRAQNCFLLGHDSVAVCTVSR